MLVGALMRAVHNRGAECANPKFVEAIAKLGIIETLPLPIDQKVIKMAAGATPRIAFEQISATKNRLS